MAAVIEKLSPAWKNFKSYLKHKRNEMSLEDLLVCLRIEEDNRESDKKFSVALTKTNVVEHGDISKGKKPKHVNNVGPKGEISEKKLRFLGNAIIATKMSQINGL